MPGDTFYSSPAWFKARQQCLKRQGYRCSMCGTDIRGRGRARVDHKRTRREAPELELEPSNLRGLCPTCDNRRHADKGGSDRLQRVGSDGIPLDRGHHWHKSYTCPQCGAISYNLNDLREGYCVRCHDWTGDQGGDRPRNG